MEYLNHSVFTHNLVVFTHENLVIMSEKMLVMSEHGLINSSCVNSVFCPEISLFFIDLGKHPQFATTKNKYAIAL